MKSLILISLVLVSLHAQSQNQVESSCRNCIDSLGNKTGVWINYDAEGIKLSEANRSALGKLESIKYFTRNADELNDCIWDFNNTRELIAQLQKRLAQTFVFNDDRYVVGRAIILLIFNHEKDIYELRILRGITSAFDKELARAIKVIENDPSRPIPVNEANSTLLNVFPFPPKEKTTNFD